MKKTNPNSTHKVKDGTCTTCRRTGSDLRANAPCPGYPTAADCGVKWRKQKGRK